MLSTRNDVVLVATCEWSQRGRAVETQGVKDGSSKAWGEAGKEVEKEVGKEAVKETRDGAGR